MEKTMECERCGKIIKKMGNRKYCTPCRVAKDHEFSRERRERMKKEKAGTTNT